MYFKLLKWIINHIKVYDFKDSKERQGQSSFAALISYSINSKSLCWESTSPHPNPSLQLPSEHSHSQKLWRQIPHCGET